jgi:phasin family protein
MATNPRHAERDDIGHETSRRAADQTTQATRTMADAAERTARAGAESVRRNAETLTDSWRDNSEAASRIAERSMDQLNKVFGLSGETARQAMEQSSGNLQALIESTTIIAGGFQNVAGEWMRFAQSRLEENFDHLDEMMGCRTLQECLALQTQIARDHFHALLESARRTSELSTRVADEAVRKVSNSTLAPR